MKTTSKTTVISHLCPLLLAALVFLLFATPARAEYLPPAADACAGIRNLMLIYNGDFDSQTWTRENFLPYVFHLDSSGKPDDRFFDGFLFLAQRLVDGQATEADPRAKPTDMRGWTWFLDRVFEKGKSIDALDAAAASAPAILPPGELLKVVLMIPYPAPAQADFGDGDADGRSENFADPEARLRAVRWYVTTALDRWRAAAPSHLKLAGFYWMEESYHGNDIDLTRAVAALLNDAGLRFFWIPYYLGVPGSPSVADMGFDCAAWQPNYFFPRWQAEKSRVASTARKARRAGMGVEMELDDSALSNPSIQVPKYLRYLNTGVREGFMTGSYHAWYQSVRALDNLRRSPDPRFHALYDATHAFVRGTYTLTPETWSE